MSEHLRRECGKNSANKKMLKVTQKSVSLPEPCCVNLLTSVCVMTTYISAFQVFAIYFVYLQNILKVDKFLLTKNVCFVTFNIDLS